MGGSKTCPILFTTINVMIATKNPLDGQKPTPFLVGVGRGVTVGRGIGESVGTGLGALSAVLVLVAVGISDSLPVIDTEPS